MHWQNSGKAQVNDVKMAIILIEFLIHKDKVNPTIFKRIFD